MLVALRRATRSATLDDLIIADYSLDRAEDRAHHVEIVRQAALDVLVPKRPPWMANRRVWMATLDG